MKCLVDIEPYVFRVFRLVEYHFLSTENMIKIFIAKIEIELSVIGRIVIMWGRYSSESIELIELRLELKLFAESTEVIFVLSLKC